MHRKEVWKLLIGKLVLFGFCYRSIYCLHFPAQRQLCLFRHLSMHLCLSDNTVIVQSTLFPSLCKHFDRIYVRLGFLSTHREELVHLSVRTYLWTFTFLPPSLSPGMFECAFQRVSFRKKDLKIYCHERPQKDQMRIKLERELMCEKHKFNETICMYVPSYKIMKLYSFSHFFY